MGYNRNIFLEDEINPYRAPQSLMETSLPFYDNLSPVSGPMSAIPIPQTEPSPIPRRLSIEPILPSLEESYLSEEPKIGITRPSIFDRTPLQSRGLSNDIDTQIATKRAELEERIKSAYAPRQTSLAQGILQGLATIAPTLIAQSFVGDAGDIAINKLGITSTDKALSDTMDFNRQQEAKRELALAQLTESELGDLIRNKQVADDRQMRLDDQEELYRRKNELEIEQLRAMKEEGLGSQGRLPNAARPITSEEAGIYAPMLGVTPEQIEGLPYGAIQDQLRERNRDRSHDIAGRRVDLAEEKNRDQKSSVASYGVINVNNEPIINLEPQQLKPINEITRQTIEVDKIVDELRQIAAENGGSLVSITGKNAAAARAAAAKLRSFARANQNAGATLIGSELGDVKAWSNAVIDNSSDAFYAYLEEALGRGGIDKLDVIQNNFRRSLDAATQAVGGKAKYLQDVGYYGDNALEQKTTDGRTIPVSSSSNLKKLSDEELQQLIAAKKKK